MKELTVFDSFLLIQASSEHPLGKAILQYARHFHFFDGSAPTNGTQNDAKELKSGWLYDASDFSAIPGRGVQCFIGGKRILVMSFGYCNMTSLSEMIFIFSKMVAYLRQYVLNRLVIGSCWRKMASIFLLKWRTSS